MIFTCSGRVYQCCQCTYSIFHWGDAYSMALKRLLLTEPIIYKAPRLPVSAHQLTQKEQREKKCSLSCNVLG